MYVSFAQIPNADKAARKVLELIEDYTEAKELWMETKKALNGVKVLDPDYRPMRDAVNKAKSNMKDLRKQITNAKQDIVRALLADKSGISNTSKFDKRSKLEDPHGKLSINDLNQEELDQAIGYNPNIDIKDVIDEDTDETVVDAGNALDEVDSALAAREKEEEDKETDEKKKKDQFLADQYWAILNTDNRYINDNLDAASGIEDVIFFESENAADAFIKNNKLNDYDTVALPRKKNAKLNPDNLYDDDEEVLSNRKVAKKAKRAADAVKELKDKPWYVVMADDDFLKAGARTVLTSDIADAWIFTDKKRAEAIKANKDKDDGTTWSVEEVSAEEKKSINPESVDQTAYVKGTENSTLAKNKKEAEKKAKQDEFNKEKHYGIYVLDNSGKKLGWLTNAEKITVTKHNYTDVLWFDDAQSAINFIKIDMNAKGFKFKVIEIPSDENKSLTDDNHKTASGKVHKIFDDDNEEVSGIEAGTERDDYVSSSDRSKFLGTNTNPNRRNSREIFLHKRG